MAEADFVPFVARPASGRAAQNANGDADVAVELAQPTAQNANGDADVAVELAQPTAQNANGDADVAVELARPTCDHSRQIRNEAIRLAAIACGRALRRAIVMHPCVISGFVDDAMAAVGSPRQGRIRVHPDAAGAITSGPLERVADASVDPGGVWLELDGTSIEATVDSFATILARAAAEA